MSWTMDFVSEWRRYFSLPSVLRYRNFKLREATQQLRPGKVLSLSLHHPVRANLHLREMGSDPWTMEEIFVEEVYALACDNVPNCKTVVDLGANIGLATLYLGARYPEARLISVEPFPETFALLERNVAPLTKTHRVHTEHAAIWNHDGDLEMEFPANVKRDDYDSVTVKASTMPQAGSQRVAAISMPSLLAKYKMDQVDLLKVDIEGAEVALFEGALDWLQRVRAIAIEFHGDSRVRSGFDAIMRDRGWTIRAENHHTVLAIAPAPV